MVTADPQGEADQVVLDRLGLLTVLLHLQVPESPAGPEVLEIL